MWLRDPIRALRKAHGKALDRGDVDVLIQSDYDESNDAACTRHEHCGRSAWCNARTGRCEDEVCGGFYYLRSAPPAIAFLEALFERMAWQRKHVDARIGEQPALNYVLRRTPGVRYRILPRARYPNGNAYFGFVDRMVQVSPGSMRELLELGGTGDDIYAAAGLPPPVIVHNNWLAGFEAKRQRFVDHGMWHLREDGTCRENDKGATA